MILCDEVKTFPILTVVMVTAGHEYVRKRKEKLAADASQKKKKKKGSVPVSLDCDISHMNINSANRNNKLSSIVEPVVRKAVKQKYNVHFI